MSESRTDLIERTASGLFCAAGGFAIDPSRPVARAIITHAHGDHTRRGSREYFCAESGRDILRYRLRSSAPIHAVPYGESFQLGETTVSLHPAGHILGSAQVRVECEGVVWAISGDYKREADPSCEPFEVVRCDVFVSEATFARPAFRWDPPADVVAQILAWWDTNRRAGRTSLLFAYALGKAQRILAELARLTDRAVFVHERIEPLVACYRAAGIRLLPSHVLPRRIRSGTLAGELVLAPPFCSRTDWIQRFGDVETAAASGWVGADDAPAFVKADRGFMLSDHADWDSVVRTIRETGARRVRVVHGESEALLRHLRGQGLDADAF